MSSSSATTSIPKGSWVLVTGVNGFIASHVAQKFLQRGYKVRGTVRSISKSDWLLKEVFPSEAANGSFELVTVEDMAEENAFRDAVRGVAAIIHVATINTLDPDPNHVVAPAIAGVVNLLKSAAEEPSVKQFVYTSSVGAAVMPVVDVPFHVDPKSWNDAAVSMAWAPPPYGPERAMVTYMASKVEAEKAFWKFVDEQHPSFIANAVLPFTTFGPLLNKQQKPSTDGLLFSLFNGDMSVVSFLKGFAHVDVRDVASLHVAAALDPSVQHARLQAWSKGCNWNDVLAIFKKIHPDKGIFDPVEGQGQMLGTCDRSVEARLLETWGDQGGWIGLEKAVTDTVDGVWPEVVRGVI